MPWTFLAHGERPGCGTSRTRGDRAEPSGRPNRARLGFRHDPGVLLNLAVVAAQRPAAEQEAPGDRAAGEDAGDPPERGVVAVRERLLEQGLAADQPDRGDVQGPGGRDGAGEDG